MNASAISALAALAGAAIGGLTSVLASWLTQRAQARAQWLAQDKLRRLEIYKEFIEEASKSHICALQNHEPDMPALVGLYAKISRMRVLSSPEVVERGDKIARIIVDTYLAPNKTLPELREMVNSGSLDLLRDFSEACRAELESLRARVIAPVPVLDRHANDQLLNLLLDARSARALMGLRAVEFAGD